MQISSTVTLSQLTVKNTQPDIIISKNGILKLLKDMNPYKATGLDELKPLLLKEHRELIAPILRVIF